MRRSIDLSPRNRVELRYAGDWVYRGTYGSLLRKLPNIQRGHGNVAPRLYHRGEEIIDDGPPDGVKIPVGTRNPVSLTRRVY